MADNQRIAQLLIQARADGLKTFDSAIQQVVKLGKAVDDQSAAADRGEKSIADLAASVKGLEAVGRTVTSQIGLIDSFNSLATQLDTATKKAEEQRQAANALKTAYEALDKPTRDQTRDLAAAQRAADSAEKTVGRLTTALDKQAEKLNAARIPTTDLAAAQQKLISTAGEIGAALSKAGEAQDSYAANVQRAGEIETARLAEAAAGYSRFEAAARRLGSAFTAEQSEARAKALSDEDQRARSAAVAYARFEAAAKSGMSAYTAQQAAAAELSAFQKIGADAQAAAASIGLVTETAKAGGGPLSSFAADVLAIVDPAAQARTSLAGLESEVARLDAEVGDAKKPMKDYQDAINALDAAQKRVLSSANDIDAYRNQEVELTRLTAQMEKHRASLQQMAGAAAQATAPDAELTAQIKAEEAALTAAAKAVDNQRAKVAQLGQALERAGINSGDLENETKRLTGVANTAAGTVGRLSQAASGQDSRIGSFLGLKKYELQNLSYQVNDVVSGIASGQHLTQVVAQQGGQIFQLFQGQLTKFVAFLPEIAIAAVILGTIFTVLKRISDQTALVRDFSASLAVNADAVNYNAKSLAQMSRAFADTGVKIADATAAVKTFVEAGVAQSSIPAFLQNAKALAKVTGTDVPSAAKALAEGFTGGYDSVVKLNSSLNFLTAAQREQIRADFDSGNSTKARQEALDALTAKLEDTAQKSRGPWSQAALNLKNAFVSFLDTVAASPPFQFLDTLLKSAGNLAQKVSGFLPGAQGKNPLETGTRFTSVSDADLKRVTQVVLSEAGGDLAAQAGVTNVIANRAFRSGGGPDSLGKVLQPSQFEVLANGAANKIDTASKTFQDAMERVRVILTSNRDQDPTNGAVNFFAPRAQAALGRQAPAFANPQLQTFAAGGTSFYRGSFPGDQVAAQQRAATQRQIGDYNDLLRTYQQAQTEAEKTDDQQRLTLVNRNALQEAYNHNLTDQQAKQIASVAVATEQFKIDQERLQQQKQLTSELASSLSAIAGASTDPEKRAEAVKVQYESLLATVKQLQQQGYKGLINGQSLADTKATILANQTIAENQARQKAYEDQLAAVESARADALKRINDQYTNGQINALDAIQQTQEVTSKYDKQLQGIVDKGKAFVGTLKNGANDPNVQKFIASLSEAVHGSDAAGISQSVKIAQDQISKLTDARSKALAGIVGQEQTGAITPVAAVQQLDATQRSQNATINSAVGSLLPTVQNLAKLHPSPDMLAFVQQLEALQKQTAAGSTLIPAASDAGKADLTIYQKAMTDLNSAISDRNSLVETYAALEEQGALTTRQAEQLSANAYKAASGPINDQIKAINALLDLLGKTGTLTADQLAAARGKLQLIGTQTTYVSATFTKLRASAEQALANGISTSVETAATDIADLIDGTQKIGDVFVDLGRITANFFATFLKSIAEAIIQLEAMQIAKAVLNSLPGGGGAGGILGIFGVHHEGGVIGGSPTRSRAVDPMVFANAPRYHSGTPGVGLSSDEQAAILRRGEEVLTEDNPRHVKNQGRQGAAPAASPTPVNIHNLFDPADLLELALSTPRGQQVIVNHVKSNSGSFRGALGVKS